MVVVINALNNEFAAATGSNANVSSDYSYFDHPPGSTKNLTITSNEGDASPNEFSVGDRYDLSWEGHSGGRMMEDATVIRSDYLGAEQGVIVFEGKDTETGEIAQIVWTPDFDLESWYWDNGGGPSSPNAFWTSDQNTTQTYQTVCFAEGTRIHTPDGPLRVEDLIAGDMVTTLDHAAQPVLWTNRDTQALDRIATDEKPVLIRAHALGPGHPARDLVVSPQHRILVGGHDQLTDNFPAEAFVPAKALTILPGVRHMKGTNTVTWVHFACASHEIVTANGCLTETLLLGPRVIGTLNARQRQQVRFLFPDNPSSGAALNGPPARDCLTVRDARTRIKLARFERLGVARHRAVPLPGNRSGSIAGLHAP